MMCAAASTSAAGRGRAPNTPSSATMTTASMSTSPKPRGRRYARHPPPAPVEQRRGLRAEGRVLERGIDPDAQHRRLVDVRGVIAAEPAPQRRRVPAAPRARETSGISITRRARRACTRARGEDARELVLVAEVPVEGAVRDAGGGDEIVDARVVVAARRRTRRAPPRAARRARGFPTHPGRPRSSSGASISSIAGPDSSAGGGGPLGRVDVHAGVHTEQRAVQHIGDGDPRRARADTRPGTTERRMPADVERVVQALQEQPDHRVELPGRQRRRRRPRVDPRDGLLAGARARPPRGPRRSRSAWNTGS